MSKETKKAQNVADKIKAISAKFDLAESVLTDDIQESVDEGLKEVQEHKQDYHPVDIMSLEQMAEDFKFSRETLRETISYGRRVLEVATQDALTNDKKASDIMSFSELVTSVLNGVKVQSQLYKDFSTVLLNIKKVISESSESTTTNNTINITENISTTDLIERMRNKD